MLPAQEDGTMSFFDHVIELRKRVVISVICLVVGIIVGLCTYKYYLPFILEPLGVDDLEFHEVGESFKVMFRLSLYVGLVLSAPMHVYNVVAFIVPALSGRARRMLSIGLCASFLLTAMGVGMAYFYILPWAIDFFHSDSLNPMDVDFSVKITTAVMFAVNMLLGFAVLFQAPLILEILMAFNLVSRRSLLKWSRYAVVVIFVLSAIVTPQDIMSQIALSVPLIFLYFLAIVIAKICGFGETGLLPDDDSSEAT
ncbi:twin arginine-targeting protein translocase TatC [bacterium M21]|nr:twin arginine-targeting protein translocase TatC [bacterium M21]